MTAYANLHLAFERMRVLALPVPASSNVKAPPRGEETSEPPRVLIIGPENSGKTTVAKILVNYATRAGQGWCPFLVNVDPSEVAKFVFSIILQSTDSLRVRADQCYQELSQHLQSRHHCKPQHHRILLAALPPQHQPKWLPTRYFPSHIGMGMKGPNATLCC